MKPENPRDTLIKSLKDLPDRVVPYRKEMRYIVGTVNASILWQQLEYWFEIMNAGRFYKFLSALGEEKFGYREGDSWTEELAFSETEFRTAFSRLGVAYKSKKEFKAQDILGDIFKGKMYCSYFDKITRQTHYFRNKAMVDVNLQRLQKIVYEGLKIPSSEIEVDDSNEPKVPVPDESEDVVPTKPDDAVPINTESTAETTSESIAENTQESIASLPEASSGSDSCTEEEIENSSDRGDTRPKLTKYSELLLLRFYKKYIYFNCHSATPSVVIGIRRILRIFGDRYQRGSESILLLLLILKCLPNQESYRDLAARNPLTPTPKFFFGEDYIYGTLLNYAKGMDTENYEEIKDYITYGEINKEAKAMCVESGREIEYLFLKPNGKPY